VLIAAKPTPRVMPRKYFPSRVNLSLRGGRQRRASGARPNPPWRVACSRLAARVCPGPAGSRDAPQPLSALVGGRLSLFWLPCFACFGRLRGRPTPPPKRIAQRGTGTRATMSRMAASASSRWARSRRRGRRGGCGGRAPARRDRGCRRRCSSSDAFNSARARAALDEVHAGAGRGAEESVGVVRVAVRTPACT
jgi:hypothetical protein